MDPFPGTCEIVEVREDLDSAQRLKESRSLGCGPILDDTAEKCSMRKMARKYTIEDDINKLFEAIDLRASATDLGLSRHSSTNSLRQSASKKPIRGGVSHASGIGISESVTLKQALRGLCISHASEIAAMKRLSKSVVRPSSISEVRAIKKLYRAVVVEANESGLPQDEGKGGLVEISFVPEQSEVNFSKKISLQAPREEPLSSSDHPSSPFASVPTTEGPMIKSLKEEEIVPVPTETERDISTVIERHTSKEPERQASTLKLGKEGKPNLTLSLSKLKSRTRAARPNDDVSISTITGNKKEMLHFGKNLKLKVSSSLRSSAVESKVNKSANNNPCVGMSVLKSKCFLNKKRKTESVSACFSSNTCNADDNNGMSPSTSKSVCRSRNCNQNLTKESPGLSSGCLDVKVSISNTEIRANKSGFSVHNCNRANFDATSSECSRSREPAEFSQSSKSSVGEYSNSTCISEESHFCGFSCSGSRPHMSKDLRWDAIRLVEMQYGSLGLRHFKMLKRLGCGDVGTVYLAELTGTDCLFAVKVMDIDSLASKKKMSRAQTEREILQMLDHPFLPTLFAHFATTKFSILVMEYCPGGDLHILRQKHSGRTFTEQAARFYVAEVLLALEYLHMLGIVYRDLKPENILVREDGHIMLSDFDLSLRCTVNPTLVKTSSIIAPAKKVSHPCVEASCIDPFCLQPSWVQVPCFIPRLTSTSTKPRMLAQAPQLLAEPTSARSNSFVGTHEYLAPEIIRGEGHGNAVDWWTFGIFLYELLYGTTPFKGLGNDETLANVVMHSIKFPESPSISSQAKDLIKGLLAKEPKNRFGSVQGAGEIKQHPFFEGLNWALIRCATPPMLPKSCGDTGALSLDSEENKLVKNKRTAEEHPEFELF